MKRLERKFDLINVKSGNALSCKNSFDRGDMHTKSQKHSFKGTDDFSLHLKKVEETRTTSTFFSPSSRVNKQSTFRVESNGNNSKSKERNRDSAKPTCKY